MSDSPAQRTTLLDQLPDKLRASAIRPTERAAVAVLLAHGAWLRHPGFLVGCVRELHGEAWIIWRLVRRFLARTPCPDLDHEVLLLAVELALSGSDARLHRSPVLAAEMDGLTRELVAAAIGEMRAQRGAGCRV